MTRSANLRAGCGVKSPGHNIGIVIVSLEVRLSLIVATSQAFTIGNFPFEQLISSVVKAKTNQANKNKVNKVGVSLRHQAIKVKNGEK